MLKEFKPIDHRYTAYLDQNTTQELEAIAAIEVGKDLEKLWIGEQGGNPLYIIKESIFAREKNKREPMAHSRKTGFSLYKNNISGGKDRGYHIENKNGEFVAFFLNQKEANNFFEYKIF